jgi:transposase
MIQITPHMRLLVAVEPIDFRAGIDGLAGICRQRLAADPFSGGLFIFRNRARTAIKILGVPPAKLQNALDKAAGSLPRSNICTFS